MSFIASGDANLVTSTLEPLFYVCFNRIECNQTVREERRQANHKVNVKQRFFCVYHSQLSSCGGDVILVSVFFKFCETVQNILLQNKKTILYSNQDQLEIKLLFLIICCIYF